MTFKEKQEVSTTAKYTLAEKIFDKDQEEEDIDWDESDSDPVEPPGWEDGVDPNLNDESWIRQRGSNKNLTRGVIGRPQAGHKGTLTGPKGTQ